MILPSSVSRTKNLLLLLGAVLDQRRHEHARPLADHLAGRLGAAELLGDDRRSSADRTAARRRRTRFGHVAVEVAALDRLEAELRWRARRCAPPRPSARPGPSGGGLLLRSSSVQFSSRNVLHLGAKPLVLGAVAQIHNADFHHRGAPRSTGVPVPLPAPRMATVRTALWRARRPASGPRRGRPGTGRRSGSAAGSTAPGAAPSRSGGRR